jgi:hypothetical protein
MDPCMWTVELCDRYEASTVADDLSYDSEYGCKPKKSKNECRYIVIYTTLP